MSQEREKRARKRRVRKIFLLVTENFYREREGERGRERDTWVREKGEREGEEGRYERGRERKRERHLGERERGERRRRGTLQEREK